MSVVWRYVRIEHIISEELENAPREVVVSIEEDVLKIKKDEIGTHSIRSGAVRMTVHIVECPVCTIMMMERWSSDAFLRYIRKQVEQFSYNIFTRMFPFETDRHIPDLVP